MLTVLRRRWYVKLSAIQCEPSTETVPRQAENANEDCLVAEVLRNIDKNGMSRAEVAWLASTVLYALLVHIHAFQLLNK